MLWREEYITQQRYYGRLVVESLIDFRVRATLTAKIAGGFLSRQIVKYVIIVSLLIKDNAKDETQHEM